MKEDCENYLNERTKLPVKIRFEKDKIYEDLTGRKIGSFRIPLDSISKTFFKKEEVKSH